MIVLSSIPFLLLSPFIFFSFFLSLFFFVTFLGEGMRRGKGGEVKWGDEVMSDVRTYVMYMCMSS